ncbi:MAG: bifunctional UDP-N-acetylglucosamine diphosphorylase/glucosamine-1-phosphate N-acetyltransferase GlmU [Chloroflexota bacterium]|jgi:bifunctional UDP-N-acetylglucosamine pyrophosphorylase/glucosamine-1-phosphate N-acetyltransferase|nr:bifunctional UDP-N-acetylglucosamine diphosphorylase/glucosamine-1-phosphate N-acetyltransferase GlmU [Chloroflexota bacterium]MDH5243388.1 bifunctional UDP-N-acetylglucosamine diphosphorylase/glucosamine-1-phosphate N-acetyltransferase GlmU [Chloroflexota bacterium]
MNPPSPSTDPSAAQTLARRTSALILAAGLGTRMKSTLPKVLHELCGRPMLAFVLDAWEEAAADEGGVPRPVIVYSPAVAAIREAFEVRAEFALQDEPRGTGDAVRAGLAAVPDDAAEVLVLSGDVPLITAADLDAVLEARREDDAAIALATVFSADPAALGRVVRSEFGTVERIVEAKDATEDELVGNEVNVGLYAFDAAWLRRRIESLEPSPATGELYLTELIRLAREDGRLVSAVAFDDDGRFDGINDRSQLAAAEWNLRVRRNEAHMRAGVTMRDPSTVYLDWDVTLAPDVTLEPNVILRGRTSIGQGSTIGAGSQLIDSEVGERARVWASIVESSTVEDEATVGPFSHLRPGSIVGRGAEVGNYAELKNAHLGAGAKQHHMSYLGDADIGERANIGAGTITANYDGVRKHRTIIGAGAFIGVDTSIVAPREIGDGARTGAGAVVTHDVPPGTLVVGVPAHPRPPKSEPATDDPPA